LANTDNDLDLKRWVIVTKEKKVQNRDRDVKVFEVGSLVEGKKRKFWLSCCCDLLLSRTTVVIFTSGHSPILLSPITRSSSVELGVVSRWSENDG
jgi:hypothetical protein